MIVGAYKKNTMKKNMIFKKQSSMKYCEENSLKRSEKEKHVLI